MSALNVTLPSRPPSLGLLGTEPIRAMFEYARLHLMSKKKLPRGDGEPVVIFPGLASDKRATAPLHDFCRGLGYTVYDWGRGLNVGPQGHVDRWLEHLAHDVHELTAHHRAPLNLVGWSLGGIYARELAKLMSDRVRQVITIGTPFAGGPQHTNVGWLYERLNGSRPAFDKRLLQRLRKAPEVPTTSIYSRGDGVVAWQACVQPGRARHVDNVEIDGSHVGMGWNPQALKVIAHKLAPA